MDIGPGPDDDGAEGLRDIVHRAQRKPLLLVLDIGQSADQDHGRVFGQDCLLEVLQQSEAVHIRHDDVQENQRESFGLGHAEALLSREAYGHFVIGGQDGFQVFGLSPAVFDDQYFVHIFP